MAPPKTTGSGKPAITTKEKAEKYGITEAAYKERSKIGKEMRDNALKYISTKAKGVSGRTEKNKIFADAWKIARAEAVKKYGESKFKALNIETEKKPSKSRIAAKKTKKRTTKARAK